MRKTITLGAVGIAGVVTTGLLALPLAAAVSGDDPAGKRDEDTNDVVLIEEDDDLDDTSDRSQPGTRDRTGPGTADRSHGHGTLTGESRQDESDGDESSDSGSATATDD